MKLSNELVKELEELDTKISEAVTSIHQEAEELRTKYDGRSEKWQESEAGQVADEQISNVEALADNLESVQLDMGEVLDKGD